MLKIIPAWFNLHSYVWLAFFQEAAWCFEKYTTMQLERFLFNSEVPTLY